MKKYLEENNIENSEKIEEKIFLSKPSEEFKIIAKNILNKNIEILNLKLTKIIFLLHFLFLIYLQ